jgi:ribosomal protein S18 acetylase RimI-like enzyme
VAMTEAVTGRVDRPTAPVAIRAYRPMDHRACRSLWAELTESQRELFDDRTLGGSDPGAGFEEYLTRLDLSGMWVAEHRDEGVVGFVGLVLGDPINRTGGINRSGQVEPIVVASHLRDRGIGRALLDHVAGEARRRGLTNLTISPVSRNVEAIRCFYAAGYDVLASVTLTLDLAPRGHRWRDGLDLHELRFSY